MKQRAPIVERLRNFEEGGFKILPASNDMLQKKTAIHLALENRDEELQRFKDFMKLFSQFKETLAQDGYADMYVLMKQFIKSGYDGPIFCDHSHRSVNAELLGSKTNMATSSAFIQGLIYAARSELGEEMAAQLAKISNSTSVSIN